MLGNLTPPQTAEQSINNLPPQVDTTYTGGTPQSAANARGRQKVRKDRAMAYRQLYKDRLSIIQHKRLADRYTKRLQREKEKTCRVTEESRSSCQTPKSKVKSLLQRAKVTNQVRKMLLFHVTLTDEMKKRMKQRRMESDKQLISKLCAGKVLNKYKLKTHAAKSTNISCARANTCRNSSLTFERKPKCDRMKKTVEEFFIRDDISRLTTSKKDTVTRGKVKHQRRLSTASMKHLHQIFIKEHSSHMSYSTFTRFRPFWVVQPTLRDKETCLCKIHENGQLIVDAMVKLKLVRKEHRRFSEYRVLRHRKSELCISHLSSVSGQINPARE